MCSENIVDHFFMWETLTVLDYYNLPSKSNSDFISISR